MLRNLNDATAQLTTPVILQTSFTCEKKVLRTSFILQLTNTLEFQAKNNVSSCENWYYDFVGSKALDLKLVGRHKKVRLTNIEKFLIEKLKNFKVGGFYHQGIIILTAGDFSVAFADESYTSFQLKTLEGLPWDIPLGGACRFLTNNLDDPTKVNFVLVQDGFIAFITMVPDDSITRPAEEERLPFAIPNTPSGVIDYVVQLQDTPIKFKREGPGNSNLWFETEDKLINGTLERVTIYKPQAKGAPNVGSVAPAVGIPTIKEARLHYGKRPCLVGKSCNVKKGKLAEVLN